MAHDAFSKGGKFSSAVNYSGLDPNTIAVLFGVRWTDTDTEYAFAGSIPATRLKYYLSQGKSDYNDYDATYPDGQKQVAGFEPVTEAQKIAIRTSMDLLSSYTKLTFEKSDSYDQTTPMRFAQDTRQVSPLPPSTGGYPPQEGFNPVNSGDVWLASNAKVEAAFIGSDEFSSIMHEIGHALGLKHGHETTPNGALAYDFDNHEFSVMTYRTYAGAPFDPIKKEVDGSSPQSYMMFDIAAMQSMYGANFNQAGKSVTYRWDATTGQQFINNTPDPNYGVSSKGKIFSTVWTQGATTTYDLHDFSQDQFDDLRPGKWLLFSNEQRADLNPDDLSVKARGNIYNTLLYKDDTRSLIDNLYTGSGNDRIWGNAKANHLVANDGDDWIDAGAGDDTIEGGMGRDFIDPGKGYDTVRGTPAELNNDYVQQFGQYLAVDYVGLRFGLSQIKVTVAAGETTLTVGDSSLGLAGEAANGVFMVTPRGAGADAHTTVNFVPYVPDLQEGVRVSESQINGVIHRAFLTGDGAVSFSGRLEEAVSGMSNTLGAYKIDLATGRIFDVHVLVGNTLRPTAATEIDLGTPGKNVEVGFFLIQNGFTQFGDLADNLSFVDPGSGEPGTTASGQTLLLRSGSVILNGAIVFHTQSQLNPGHRQQVLSGTDGNGHDILIGFEDLPTNTADNDFQDVVIRVHAYDALIA